MNIRQTLIDSMDIHYQGQNRVGSRFVGKRKFQSPVAIGWSKHYSEVIIRLFKDKIYDVNNIY